MDVEKSKGMQKINNSLLEIAEDREVYWNDKLMKLLYLHQTICDVVVNLMSVSEELFVVQNRTIFQSSLSGIYKTSPIVENTLKMLIVPKKIIWI